MGEEADENLLVVFIGRDFMEVDLTLRHAYLKRGGMACYGGAIAFLNQFGFSHDGLIAFEVDEAHGLAEIKCALFGIGDLEDGEVVFAKPEVLPAVKDLVSIIEQIRGLIYGGPRNPDVG